LLNAPRFTFGSIPIAYAVWANGEGASTSWISSSVRAYSLSTRRSIFVGREERAGFPACQLTTAARMAAFLVSFADAARNTAREYRASGPERTGGRIASACDFMDRQECLSSLEQAHGSWESFDISVGAAPCGRPI
jgi:hypothetical protein